MAGTVGKAALLLRDAQGDKSGSLFPAFIRKKKDVAVLRGSLLIALSPKDAPSGADWKPAHNLTTVCTMKTSPCTALNKTLPHSLTTSSSYSVEYQR